MSAEYGGKDETYPVSTGGGGCTARARWPRDQIREADVLARLALSKHPPLHRAHLRYALMGPSWFLLCPEAPSRSPQRAPYHHAAALQVASRRPSPPSTPPSQQI